LQGVIERLGIDTYEDVAKDRFAGNQVTPLLTAAAESFACLGAETLGPAGDRLVTAHTAQDRPGSDRQNGGE
jgi:hypothetical protein